MRRGLGDQTGYAAAAITGDVVPDDFNAGFGNRERHGGLEVFQTVAAGHQVGSGGVFLDGGEHVSRHRGPAMSRVDRHLEAVRVTLEHRVLPWSQLVFVLFDVLRGDGELRLFAGIWVGQEATGIHGAGVGWQG